MNLHTAAGARFINFVLEREAVRLRRAKGWAAPWSEDPILRKYSFTNVRREHDRTTRWIAERWRDKYGNHPVLWFAMFLARLVNRPETLADLRHPCDTPFNRDNFERTMRSVKKRDGVALAAAYIVSTNGQAVEKTTYLGSILAMAWRARSSVVTPPGSTLEEAYARLIRLTGCGPFIAGQIIADLKNTPNHALAFAPDWFTWASPGPGSRRGMNRLLLRGVNAGMSARAWHREVTHLRELMAVSLRGTDFVKRGELTLCAQDVQNCLCEFDKYERALHGEGRPKRLYHTRPEGEES